MSVARTVENVYLRQNAAQLTRRHFWPLLGMSIIITLIVSGLDRCLTAIGDQLMTPEIEAFTAQFNHLLTSGRMTSPEPVFQALQNLLFSPKFLLFNLLFITLTTLISAGLNLGRNQQLIDTAQGGFPQVSGVFRLFRYCLKAWAVEAWILFKVILWMLPGIAVIVLGSELVIYGMNEIGAALQGSGFALIFALSVPALIRYWLSTYILADDPHRGVQECVNCSIGLMKDRKWQLFKLGVPVVAKMLAVSWAADILINLLYYWLPVDIPIMAYLSPLLTWAATAYFIIQLDILFVLFYLQRRDGRSLNDDGSPKPVSYWLREHCATDIAAETEAPAEDAPDVPAYDTNDETKENDHEEPER